MTQKNLKPETVTRWCFWSEVSHCWIAVLPSSSKPHKFAVRAVRLLDEGFPVALMSVEVSPC